MNYGFAEDRGGGSGGSDAEPGGGTKSREAAVDRADLQTTLRRRIHAYVDDAVNRMDVPGLLRALEAPSAIGSVAAVAAEAPDVPGAGSSSLVSALLRGAAAKEKMLGDAGGFLSSHQVAGLLGISIQAVKQRMERRTILAVPLSRGAWAFPARQFDIAAGGVQPGIPEVVRAAADMNPWVLLSILVEAAPGREGDTLLDRIADDDVRAGLVARLGTYGGHGAA
ncbi:MAG TPA: hypothetical protein VF665_01775 [Longimicrobium sp.]|jgi:hypothetical protein|uniref:hypothetical protein n=1 Tax=Longimicrobium sp. TaxID=2029185 RepID=UPI002ED8580F